MERFIKGGFPFKPMFSEILTDPLKHNPNNYIYLARGLSMLFQPPWYEADFVKKQVDMLTKPGSYYHCSLVGQLDEMSASRTFGFSRPIRQTGIYGLVALILKISSDVPIQIAWNTDLGSPSDYTRLKEFVRDNKGKLRTPLELLAKIPKSYNSYNELILEGNPETKIMGIVFTKHRDSKEMAERLFSLVNLELPLITIPLQALPESYAFAKRSALVRQQFYTS